MAQHARLAKALAELVERLRAAPGLTGSAVLYGSAARGDWHPERSDVNLLLVVDDIGADALVRLAPAFAAWHKAGFTPPLLLGRTEWQRATDVFPIELSDMQLSYQLLWGEDPIASLRVQPADLRRALEAALRGKLLRLRQAYVRFHDHPITLGGFAIGSISEFLVLLRATTQLISRGSAIAPEDAIRALADELGSESAVVTTIVAHRRDGEWSCPPDLFARYLEAVRRIVAVVDHHHAGDR